MFYVHIDVDRVTVVISTRKKIYYIKRMVVLVMVILKAAECHLTTLLVPVLTA